MLPMVTNLPVNHRSRRGWGFSRAVVETCPALAAEVMPLLSGFDRLAKSEPRQGVKPDSSSTRAAQSSCARSTTHPNPETPSAVIPVNSIPLQSLESSSGRGFCQMFTTESAVFTWLRGDFNFPGIAKINAKNRTREKPKSPLHKISAGACG